MSIDKKLLDILVCPKTKTELTFDKDRQLLISKKAGLAYKVLEGVPILLVDEAIKL